MTFQIKAVHLFNSRGDRRSLDFRLNELNIITGRSRSGKSSVIEIIDYCLGSKGYHVAAGAIRNTVVQFALELQTDEGVALVARAAPVNGRATTTTMHVSFRATNSGRPEVDETASNTDLKSGIAFLSRIMGIEENVTNVGTGTRSEFGVTIRHALAFNLQSQDEIANQDVLFHSQNEEWVPQSIRDSLPYLLGTVDPLYVLKRNQLRQNERDLKVLLRSAGDERAIGRSSSRGLGLLSEAISVGLASSTEDQSRAHIIELLTLALATESESYLPATPTNDLIMLFDERDELRASVAQTRHELRRLRSLLRYDDDFAGEVGEQRSRLESLGLLQLDASGQPRNDLCPICNSTLDHPITSVEQINSELQRVSQEIGQVNKERQDVQAAVSTAEGKLAEASALLFINQQQIDRSTESVELLDSLKNTSLQRAAVRGRISLFLDSISRETESAFVDERIRHLREAIAELIVALDSDSADDRLEGALSWVAFKMAEVAGFLGLEHSPSPVRLDLQELTVVVDTIDGRFRLAQIGSGENWLGYHLATLVGLHSFFAAKNRPVPRFLVIDQPSQVYFPADAVDQSGLRDEDRTALGRAYKAMAKLSRDAVGGFQVIVLDHADLSDDYFQEAVLEKWRVHGEALIPLEWIGN
ncbi:DUF3732 domain-containing protein [Cryobacterium sinapicolor]|uniref:DUF3732 domain-containing protein n=1 Tax=Cryobacterium sinapicolor TaxID=1259236 RepID=A0ABY2IYW4_9MICO|nr:DUF3732 domain-containing protein [Cryobacterium sinapicolor]TFC95895.1 DUF3732 domain-containing protein [Cryobacterium sinapicolor]